MAVQGPAHGDLGVVGGHVAAHLGVEKGRLSMFSMAREDAHYFSWPHVSDIEDDASLLAIDGRQRSA
jgi:hypothetical protein